MPVLREGDGRPKVERIRGTTGRAGRPDQFCPRRVWTLRRPQRTLCDVVGPVHGGITGSRSSSLTNPDPKALMHMPVAGLLGWLVPGLGHIYLGHRGRGLVFLVTITATFWSGVAIGGVRDTVAPHSRKLWFVAQMGAGGNALSAYALHCRVDPDSARSGRMANQSHWMAADAGVHYTGVAGLLNLLVVFDALGRCVVPAAGQQRERGPPGGAP